VTDKPKVHGYLDSAALDEAVQCNAELVAVLQQVVGRLGRVPQPVLLHLHRAGFLLAEQRNALAEMERIRGDYKSARR